MSTFNIMSLIMSILHIKAVTVHAYESTSRGAPQGEGKEGTAVRLATRAEGGGGGGVNIGAVIGAIAGVILILAALLLIFLKSRNRNRNPNQLRAIQYNNVPQKSIFALSSFKQPPQPLPLYTQPTSPYAQHYNGGVPMPQAVHPSTSGYYRQAGQVQQDNGVRFGGVGVVRY